ncbi:MAG: MBL fold metallo-hydrolase [Planctomycetota bacterium]
MSLQLSGYVTGAFAENTYIAIDEETQLAAVIDPGEGALALWRKHEEDGATLDKILLTHAHLDHIWGLSELKEYSGAPIYLHHEDDFLLEGFVSMAAAYGFEVAPAPPADQRWDEGDTVAIGATTLRILHTPGHSPGSVSLVWEDGVFTGDVIMAGGIGRTDFPRSSFTELAHSIREKLYRLPDDLAIYSGHGPPSTIGHEKATNPSIRPE